jgi:hypothetical protein
MSKGVLLFAYNTRQVDYIRLALLSGKLAKEKLNVPVSLVTDKSTLAWSRESKIYDKVEDIFENVIISENDNNNNYRILHDGDTKEKIPFKNFSRALAWDLTPYDKTLLIDSDFLILSNTLSNYWDMDEDFLISPSIKDLHSEDRMQHYDRYISDVGIKMLWATTIIFNKNQRSRIIFDLIKHIRDNYNHYSEIYRFDNRIYRNDIAFSIANHTCSGFLENVNYTLPPILSTLDRDILIDVENDALKFLLYDHLKNNYLVTTSKNIDIHVMNKQSIIRNFDKLMEIK